MVFMASASWVPSDTTHMGHSRLTDYTLEIFRRFLENMQIWLKNYVSFKLYAKKEWQNFEILRKLQIYGNWTIYVTLSKCTMYTLHYHLEVQANKLHKNTHAILASMGKTGLSLDIS